MTPVRLLILWLRGCRVRHGASVGLQLAAALSVLGSCRSHFCEPSAPAMMRFGFRTVERMRPGAQGKTVFATQLLALRSWLGEIVCSDF